MGKLLLYYMLPSKMLCNIKFDFVVLELFLFFIERERNAQFLSSLILIFPIHIKITNFVLIYAFIGVLY